MAAVSAFYFVFLFFCLSSLMTVFVCVGLPFKAKGSPVILIPGDGGTHMLGKLDRPKVKHYYCRQRTSDYFNIWLNLEELVPYIIDCWSDNIKLTYNNKTRRTTNQIGVDVKIPHFGNTSSVEWLDPSKVSYGSYFAPLVDKLITLGYERGITVRGAPYDFRKAPNEGEVFFKNLTNLIEETYKKNDNKRVVLVTHSMGGPYALYLLNHKSQEWKDKYIKSLTSLGGPWTGAVKIVRVFTSGDNLGTFVVNALELRPAQRTYPSSAWLYPNDKFWDSKQVVVETPTRNYTLGDHKQLFKDLGIPYAYDMWLDTKDLIGSLTAPGVPVFCLHGSEVPTGEKFIYDDSHIFPDDQPIILTGDGDGTVNMKSLKACLLWKDQQKHPVLEKGFPGNEHVHMLQNNTVIDYIIKNVLMTPDNL
ncbi:lysosomal phospholipase A and acyltransferase-like [Saccoglossus kowalevskii]|uniref:Group XV phospholipase A2-like n=1 Tax=Saccoglossus kowalevskii TaxID=10224 RepID=A0ABM0GWR0_SACKO|nr:PREDICTED: group XV phospholipase A2-like [Saccoglossus kowalevskii]